MTVKLTETKEELMDLFTLSGLVVGRLGSYVCGRLEVAK